VALIVTHSYSSLVADGAEPGLVKPSHWNAQHTVTGNLPVTQLDSGTNASNETVWTGAGAWKRTVPPYVNIKDFGAKGDGSTDDTSSINAAYASLAGSAGTVIWPPGNYKVTDTIVCGIATGGTGAATSFIGTLCPGGQDHTVLQWHGATTGRPAFLMAKNKYNQMTGLRIQNATGTKGTSIGLQLGGSGSGAFGTQTLSFWVINCLISGFNVGATDGNFGACSEIAWASTTFDSCDTGFTLNDFNSLDHVFYEAAITANTIGIDTGVSSEIHVYGGSGSQNGVDFNIGGNSQHTFISGFRSEESTSAMVNGVANGACVTVQSCLQTSALGSGHNAITGTFTRLCVKDCNLDGFIRQNFADGGQVIELTGNKLTRWDTSRSLPIQGAFSAGNPTSVQKLALFRDNLDGSGSNLPILEYSGPIGYKSDYSTGAFPFSDPVKTVSPMDFTGSPSNFFSWQSLNHVRGLAEGMVPGATSTGGVLTPGLNLRVQGVFASSNSLSFTFTRALTVSATGNANVTASAGTFLPSDVGKPLKITNGADTGADWYGQIVAYVNSTTVAVMAAPFASPGGRQPQCTNKGATVGANEPDGNYLVTGLCGDANETFWVTSISSTGFTLHSSNATSTATVTCLIVR